jgi:hypothetical protein
MLMRAVRRLLGGFCAALLPLTAQAGPLCFGADLSFAGQMADCGAVYRDSAGEPVIPR